MQYVARWFLIFFIAWNSLPPNVKGHLSQHCIQCWRRHYHRPRSGMYRFSLFWLLRTFCLEMISLGIKMITEVSLEILSTELVRIFFRHQWVKIIYSENNVGSQGWWSTKSSDLSRSNSKTEMWMWSARDWRNRFLKKFSRENKRFSHDHGAMRRHDDRKKKHFSNEFCNCVSASWENRKIHNILLYSDFSLTQVDFNLGKKKV